MDARNDAQIFSVAGFDNHQILPGDDIQILAIGFKQVGSFSTVLLD